MKIGIIGPGALGCLFACRLFLAADDQDKILLIDYKPARADRLNSQGIIYDSETDSQQLSIPVSSTPADLGTLDVLFFCVKSYDLSKSIEFAKPLFSSSTLLIFLQNGISHLGYDEGQLHGIPVFATSSEGATRIAPGHISHAGSGQTYLGFLSPQDKAANKRLKEVSSILNRGAISCTVSSDIQSRIWAKLFINVGINALTAIYRRTNGELLTSSEPLKKLKQLVREAELVANSIGISIKEDPVAATLTVCEHTSRNISSMFQDVRNHRPTEIDSINGAISRLGKENSIATPLNDEIITQIKTIEKNYNEYRKP